MHILFFKFRLLPLFLTPLLFSWLCHGKLNVLIDPGHGGEDYGGTIHGLAEEFVVFEVSEFLQEELKALNINCELTRKKTQAISLEERVKLAIKKKPEAFISIHANVNADPQIKGAEFYVEPSNALLGHTDFLTFLSSEPDLKSLSPDNNPRFYYPNIKKLKLKSPVNIIMLDMLRMKTRRQSLDLAESLKTNWNGKSEIREGQFYLIKQLPIPSTLVELGYLSHPNDYKTLNSREKRRLLAKSLALGLKEYFQKKEL